MKAAVSSSGKDLDAQVDPRFGRCAYFIIVDTDDMSYDAYNNDNSALGGGAGIQSAQFVASKGAKVVLTGNVGPNAVKTLSAAGVEVIVGQTGTVKEAINAYRKGNLNAVSEANVSDHHGAGSNTVPEERLSQVAGGGVGRGMGRGGRCGGGMGMGRGKGMGMGMGVAPSSQTGAASLSRDEELSSLKNQIAELRGQIESIASSINTLVKK
ncbi:MAG: dinitrogenase iron-molybdenum cofactor biosynthesis protein [Deltaproteobacteria bacterium]|nr:MAG: dinitrogenase iron-molybdenum cofactor biosynthesis protein [Deltaproteobacteria bacterium]